jgi:hypothetical protein
MVGSPLIASFIAHVTFWGLLAYGWALGELGLKALAIFLLLWLAGCAGLPHVAYEPARALFSSFVAILDIALVFRIFKGDVRFFT